jgi:glycosyltransferase involved in cell wall biosynthesis
LLFPRAKKVFYTKQNLSKKVPWPFTWIQRWVFRTSRRALVISEEARAVLKGKGYAGPDSILPHSFNPANFYPRTEGERNTTRAAWTIPHGSFVAGYFGRLTEEKGIRDILAAASSIFDKQDLKNIYFLLVGNGPLLPLVAKFAESANGRLLSLQAIPHDSVQDAIAAVDLLLLPSRTTRRWKEQFGRVIIEAAACGIPVVGSDSGEIPRLIKRTGCGLSFREGETEEIVAAIRALATDRSAYEKASRNGRDAVLAEYVHQAVADNLAGTLAGI